MSKKKEVVEEVAVAELDLDAEKETLLVVAAELNSKPAKLAKLITALDEKTTNLFTSSQFVAEQFTDAVEVKNVKVNLDYINQSLDEVEKLLTEALEKE